MPKPLVTGISPKEGFPGTKVTIRGEFLGRDEEDLVSVKICGVDCTLRAKWEKDNRIVTYTGMCIGKGDIVVTTRSGGSGSSSVGFQGMVKKSIGFAEETCVWMDEDVKSFLTGLKRNNVVDLLHDNPLKISVDESGKLGNDFLDKEFPNTSIDITKDNFSAARFLIENYQNAKFEDLKTGLTYMKSNLGPKSANSSENLLKTNISSFMDAIKIMKDVNALSLQDKGAELTRPMEQMIRRVMDAAHRIYDQDLASKERADMIRASLQIVDTYKSLIYFPQHVDNCLQDPEGENYEQIVQSYKLAQSQLAKIEQASPASRQSRLFAQIKRDLDDKVAQVQQHILDKLVQFPSSPDDQKYLIDYYNALEVMSTKSGNIQQQLISPGWHCLIEGKKWLVQLMIECRDMNMADEKVSLALKESASMDKSKQSDKANESTNRTLEDEHNTTALSSASPSVNRSMSGKMSASEAARVVKAMTTVPHERNKFIEELCQLFFDHFSDYWRLSVMYMSNALSLPTTGVRSARGERASQSSLVKQHSSDEVYALVSEILTTFTNIVRGAFIPHTFKKEQKEDTSSSTAGGGKSLFQSWPTQHDAKIISQILPHCLRICRMCALQIHSLDIPLPLFENIQSLVYDLRCECLKILLTSPTREILATLGKEEQDWIVERDIDGENQTCLITKMPIRFEAKLTKSLTLCKEYVLDDRKGERPLFKDPAFNKQISLYLYGILHSLLKRVYGLMTGEEKLPATTHLARSKLLLYLYNNLAYCKRVILPNFSNLIVQHKYKQTDQILKESKKNVQEQQDMVLKQYQQEVINPIVQSIETNLYIGHYDFTDSSTPTSARNYVKLILTSMLNVHSELFLLNKSLIPVVFNFAVKNIYERLFALFSNVPRFGSNAAIQTYVDMFCLREVLKAYTTSESKDIMNKIIKLIPTTSFEANKNLITRLISEFLTSMRPFVLVFQTPIQQSESRA